jgi:type I restriction enzyme, S subunit
MGWYFKLNDLKFISEELFLRMNGGKLRIGDIIVTKDGATIGKTAIIEQMFFSKMAINEHMFLLRPAKNIYPKFLYFQIISIGLGQIRKIMKDTAIPGVNTSFSTETFLTYQPLKEQIEIAEYLDHKTNTIDSIVSNITKQIKGLKELRKTLINDVVTGKLKVTE